MYWETIEHKLVPRENQKIAIDKGIETLNKHGFVGLLMKMALGKTKCSLNIAEILKKHGAISRILVISPKAILSEWYGEIKKNTFIESAPLLWENKKTQKFAREAQGLFFQEFPVLFVKLETFQAENKVLKSYLDEYMSRPTIVILDESSKIKNVKTARTPRLIEYTEKAEYKVILTGTPWGESPLDIFAQMEFLQRGFWYQASPSFKKSELKKHLYFFEGRYAIKRRMTTSEGRSFDTIVGCKNKEEIASKLAPYVIIQDTEDWLDLPPQNFLTVELDMNKEQAAAYESMKEDLIAEYGDTLLTAKNAGVMLTRLRQIAGGFVPEMLGSSLPGIEYILDDSEDYPGKVIITAVYVPEIEGIVKALTGRFGSGCVATYYGGTKDYAEEKERFQNDQKCKYMVLNPDSGAYGLNLQFASLMYMYSRSFSSDKNEQLEARIYRPGQKNKCVYKDILHRGTVQYKVLIAVKNKADFADEFKGLTLKEILK